MARGISPETSGAANLGSTTQRWGTLFANEIDPGAYIPGAYNKKETFTTSGTFTAPVTGTYRITVKGGGGGGQGGYYTTNYAYGGHGGGEGGTTIAYEKMTVGQTASVVIGAGGSGGEAQGYAGTDGGASSVTVNSNTYTGGGGRGDGPGGTGTIRGASGGITIKSTVPSAGGAQQGATGGGQGGGYYQTSAVSGGGGQGGGGTLNLSSSAGYSGGDGFVWFEYYDTNA